MITEQMVEAACAYRWPTYWLSLSEEGRSLRKKSTRGILEAAEAVRPKMVEVAEVTHIHQYGGGLQWTDSHAMETLPAGTKLYAKQPK